MAVLIHDMEYPPITAAQLYVSVQQAWVVLGSLRVKTLVRSMLCQVRAILAARDGHTHY